MIEKPPQTIEHFKILLRKAKVCKRCENIYYREEMNGNFCRTCFLEKGKLAMRKKRQKFYQERAKKSRNNKVSCT